MKCLSNSKKKKKIPTGIYVLRNFEKCKYSAVSKKKKTIVILDLPPIRINNYNNNINRVYCCRF